MRDARDRKGAVLVHVMTKKGKGYEFAENDPTAFHGTPPFDVESGEAAASGGGVSYTGVFGGALVELAKRRPVDNSRNRRHAGRYRTLQIRKRVPEAGFLTSASPNSTP